MAVRIALQCSEADAHLILSEENTAARLLTRPGEAIYNDANGLFEGNHPFQVAWLPDDEARGLPAADRGSSPAAATTPAGRRSSSRATCRPTRRKNAALRSCLSGPGWPAAAPAARAWLGAAVAIKEPTSITFSPAKRQPICWSSATRRKRPWACWPRSCEPGRPARPGGRRAVLPAAACSTSSTAPGPTRRPSGLLGPAGGGVAARRASGRAAIRGGDDWRRLAPSWPAASSRAGEASRRSTSSIYDLAPLPRPARRRTTTSASRDRDDEQAGQPGHAIPPHPPRRAGRWASTS